MLYLGYSREDGQWEPNILVAENLNHRIYKSTQPRNISIFDGIPSIY